MIWKWRTVCGIASGLFVSAKGEGGDQWRNCTDRSDHIRKRALGLAEVPHAERKQEDAQQS